MIRKAIHADFPKLCEYYREFDESGVDLFNSRPFSTMMVYGKSLCGLLWY